MSKNNSGLDRIRKFVKKQLKVKGLTYKEVAEKLNVSEITIKRWLTQRDFFVSNLLDLGRILNFEVLTLLDLDYSKPNQFQFVTPAQEMYLTKNPLDALVFLKLVANYSIENLKQELQLTETQFFKILRSLDKYKFIELGHQSKLKFIMNGPYLFKTNGPFQKHYLNKMRVSIISKLQSYWGHPQTKNRMENRHEFEMDRPFEMYLSKEMAHAFSNEILHVLNKYRNMSTHHFRSGEEKIPISGYFGILAFDLWKEVFLITNA